MLYSYLTCKAWSMSFQVSLLDFFSDCTNDWLAYNVAVLVDNICCWVREKADVNLPASLFESNQMFLYVTPFFERMSFASEIAVLSPSIVNVLMPTT